MKKLFITLLLITPFILTGCGESAEEKEAREACKEALKEVYEDSKDSTITSCLADYNKETKKVVYRFCVNENGDIYQYSGKVSKGDKYYELTRNSYTQIKDELNGSNKDYYAFEFKANELK